MAELYEKEELREDLGLPNIGGQIIAYTYYYGGGIDKVSFRIDIVLPGPDSRYKAGKASFESTDKQYQLNDIEEELKRMGVIK